MWNGLMYNVARRPEHKATALALAAQALQLAPDLPEAHVALGLCFYYFERDYPAALREFSIAAAASALEPDVVEFIGLIYCRQGRWREGIASYDRAIAVKPDCAEAYNNRGMTRLLAGQFREGWSDLEWRWKSKSFAGKAPEVDAPFWRGETLEGRRMLVFARQQVSFAENVRATTPVCKAGRQMLDTQHMRADAFATMRETVAVTLQPPR